MALPAAFLTALAKAHVRPDLWLEIEGLPFGFGMTSRAGSWFNSRSAGYQRLGVLPTLLDIPAAVDQEVKPLDGDSSIGSLEVRLDPDDEFIFLTRILSAIGRTDSWAYWGPPVWRAATFYASTGAGDMVRPTAGATGAGVGLTFKCTTGGTTGAYEPTWPASGTVTDGTVVWTAQTGTNYPRVLPANATAINGCATLLGGTWAPPSAAWPIYIGRESMVYGSYGTSNGGTVVQFYSLARQKFRIPGHDIYYSHQEGDVVTPYPRFLGTRRIALMATLDGTDLNKVIRFSGALDGRAKMDNRLNEVRLTAGSTLGELKRTLFGNQLRAKLAWGVPDGEGNYDPDNEGETSNGSYLVFVPESKSGPWSTLQVSQPTRYFRVDDEYMAGLVQGDGAVGIVARGLFGTLTDQHKPGAEAKEVLIIAKRDTSVPEFAYTYFTAGDSPVEVALALMMSTGTAGNGTYDTLPDGWGCGISQARVDTTGALAMAARWLGGTRHIEIVEEPFEAKSKLAEILCPHAFYSLVKLNDVYCIRRVQPPLPDLNVRALTNAVLLKEPTWESDFQNVIGRILWRCDFDPTDGESRQTFIGELQGPGLESQEFYAGMFQTLEVEAKGQFTGNDLSSGVPAAMLATGATEAAMAFIDLVRDRYSKPWPTLEVQCPYDYLDVEPGDLVTLDTLYVPNGAVGSRGLSGETFEVLSKSIDDKVGIVTLTLVQALYGRQARLLSPCGEVDVAGSNYVDLYTNSYGGPTDAAYFVPGDYVIIYSKSLVNVRAGYIVQSVAGNRVTFTTAISGVIRTDVMLLNSYDVNGAYRKGRNAALADPLETLGAANDPAHQYL